MKASSSTVLFLASVLASALVPFVPDAAPAITSAKAFPGWPATYEGRALTPLPMTPREVAFADGFPGRIGRFSDGQREIVLRYVTVETRRLHPASDCYRGLGYAVEPRPLRRDAQGEMMGCFRAAKGAESYEVCEAITDGRGHTWPDVSAWYWQALFGQSSGPWWSRVVAERSSEPDSSAPR